MKKLCSFLAQNLEPVTYMDEIEEEYEEIEDDKDRNSFPDPFPLGTNGEERKITLPQPNGDIRKPLKLDIGQVSFFLFCFQCTQFFSIYKLCNTRASVKIYLGNAEIYARILRNYM